MDTIVIATIASSTISLLVPYLKLVGEGIAKKAGEEIGGKAGGVAWSKAKQLHDTVKAKLSSKPDVAKVIEMLEKTPNDEDTQAAIRFHIKEAIGSDEKFGKELAAILKDATDAGADNVFQTNVAGNVQKLVQMGNVYGDVKF